MYDTEIRQINSQMLLQFTINRFEDTPVNRLDFLKGMQEAWNEDTSSSPEKENFMNALQFEIDRLSIVIAETL